MLAAAGFVVSSEEFSFSSFPAQLGPFLIGLFFALMTVASAKLSVTGSPAVALLIAIGGALLCVVASRVLLKWGLTIPFMKRSSSNLVAVRNQHAEPKVWLVAHLDSKSQTIRMLVRVGSVVTSGVLFGVFIATLAFRSSRLPIAMGIPDGFLQLQTVIAAMLTALALLPVVFCFITNKSRGALDNATGVAAAIVAAQSMSESVSAGIVITSGEELALAGARAFAANRPVKGLAINCDTVDDAGQFICMVTGRRRKAAEAVARAASGAGETARIRGMIMGILADNVAFSDAGWDSCTLSRGNLGTLARVHTSGDTPEKLDGTGIARAARILVATIEELS